MISAILVVYKPKEKLLKNFFKMINNKNNFIIVYVNCNSLNNFNLPKKTKIINTGNNGYRAAINLALKKCKTNYSFISK